jgi:hypothetical protein
MLYDFILLHDLPLGSSVLNFYYKYLAWLIETYLPHISFSF